MLVVRTESGRQSKGVKACCKEGVLVDIVHDLAVWRFGMSIPLLSSEQRISVLVSVKHTENASHSEALPCKYISRHVGHAPQLNGEEGAQTTLASFVLPASQQAIRWDSDRTEWPSSLGFEKPHALLSLGKPSSAALVPELVRRSVFTSLIYGRCSSLTSDRLWLTVTYAHGLLLTTAAADSNSAERHWKSSCRPHFMASSSSPLSSGTR